MLCIVAARTLNLILLDAATKAKHSKIVARQLSDVQLGTNKSLYFSVLHRSTGTPLFFRALRERPQQEVSD
jgi:hypothetical protein